MKSMTMKLQLTLLASLFFTSITFGQKAVEGDELIIKNLIIDSFDGIWSDLNPENIDKYYTDDFLLLEHGMVWNNDSVSYYLNKAKLRSPRPRRLNSMEFIEIKILNGRAWVAYNNQATFYIDNKIVRKANWLESANAILTENGWKLEMLHSTRAGGK